MTAVSYTHLDVYKRQLVGGLQQRLVCKAFSLLQHLCAQHTVGLDHRKFFCGQLAGLVQDLSLIHIS